MALDDEIARIAAEKSALIERIRLRLLALDRILYEERKVRLQDLSIPHLERLATAVDGATTVPEAVTMIINAISVFDTERRAADDSKLNGKT